MSLAAILTLMVVSRKRDREYSPLTSSSIFQTSREGAGVLTKSYGALLKSTKN